MKRRSPLQAFKNRLIYLGLLTANRIGRILSLSVSRTIGRSLGHAAYKLVPRERAKALRNLEIAFPTKSAAEREAIARAMFDHLGVSLMEICWMQKLDAAALERTTVVEGIEHMRAALAAGKGVLLFTGHCGNWEWMAAAIGLLGFPMNVIARDLYDLRLNDFVVRSRAHHGIKSIGRGSTSSAREMLQTLRNNEILGVLIDQSIVAENADLQFFGRSAPTPVGPARLAIKAGAAVICGFIERSGETQRLRFEAPIFPEKTSDSASLTQTITSRIEAQIRSAPSQWVWMHDRWRRRKEKVPSSPMI